MKKRKKKGFDREEILDRLLRIAEEAHRATTTERADKNGNLAVEYDARCATIELKALECAVKLAGAEETQEQELFITLEEDAKEMAL